MTIDRNPTAGAVGLRHATGLLRARRVTDESRQARDDIAEEMANGCPSVAEAARRLRISQSRADQHWQAIKDGLGRVQCQ